METCGDRGREKLAGAEERVSAALGRLACRDQTRTSLAAQRHRGTSGSLPGGMVPALATMSRS